MILMKSQNKKNFYCYIQNKPFGNYYLPTRFQYVILRDYYNKLNANFKMPQGEPIFTKTSIRLRSLISAMEPKSTLVLLSLYMFPENNQIRKILFDKIIKKNIQIHLIFEKTIIKKKKDLKKINYILKLNKFNEFN